MTKKDPRNEAKFLPHLLLDLMKLYFMQCVYFICAFIFLH